jgi:ribose/xylose/arabinose/galactoside ABC-type transport system permease subunit
MTQPSIDQHPTPKPSRWIRSAVAGPGTLPLLATVLVCGLLYGYAAVAYRHFDDYQTFINFLGGSGTAFLGVTAVGLTFVILAGGIDLSVGAVIGCSTVLMAVAVQQFHLHPLLAIPLVLGIGTAFGAGQGCLIRFFDVPPFLATLAGLFLARGAGLVISPEQIPIDHPFYARLAEVALTVGHDDRRLPVTLSLQGIIFVATLLVGLFVARFTRFGRNCYAVGGSETSAVLMGLPVGSTKVALYAVSSFCAALAGVVATLDVQKGDATYATGVELDAIAAVVVGGTALAGGSGSVVGTFLGVLTFAIVQATIDFDGRLPAAWNRIVVGGLLLAFILLQKAIGRRGR